jgi:hypothetical protein
MRQPGETREDQKRGLAAEVLQSGGSLRLQALGTSMLPCIWPGDLLTVESRTGIKIGDIVLLTREGRFFVHRLVKQLKQGEEVRWVTRGDCMPNDDPPASIAQVLGSIVLIQRHGDAIVPRRLSIGQRFFAWTLCHWEFAHRVALRLHAVRQSSRLAADGSFAQTSVQGFGDGIGVEGT